MTPPSVEGLVIGVVILATVLLILQQRPRS